MSSYVDVLIVGAGLSGIGAGYYMQTLCTERSYMILEGREAIGGTWDLFRYPGVRSDSDMYTLGYSFFPWRDRKAIANGESIRQYICDTAAEYGIDQHIRFQHRVKRASWSSDEALWTVDVVRGPAQETVQFTCRFLYMCTGYYDYEQGYTPDWPGLDEYQGQIIHPQTWPQDFDHSGKRIIVIGSGATAVTLVPALAKEAAHVTMLQRSPTYVLSMPSEDKVATWLNRLLPDWLAHPLIRWKAILLNLIFYYIARWWPKTTARMIVRTAQDELGPAYDVSTHFTPSYNPWDQRLCLVPDSDLFVAIRSGQASVVTDHIDSFTPTGICLRSGEELQADVVVTATGLKMKLMKGVALYVDDKPVDLAQTMSYKGMMYSGVPNLASAFGYTNASWTLKCELTSRYVCRLLKHMDDHGYQQCVAQHPGAGVDEEPVINFTSGYVQRALADLPAQGSRRPWKVYQNYLLDLMIMRLGAIDDGTMAFR